MLPTGRFLVLFAGLLLPAAACAQEARFAFATQAHARSVLGQEDDYVRATGALERALVLGVPGPVDPGRFASAMAETARDWSEEETSALAPVFGRLDRFVSGMKWKAPPRILIVKASGELMEGFPHTRGNAIVLQEGVLADALARPGLMDYLAAHETFHVLSRADPVLREALYRAIGFRPCAGVDLPPALAELRITNPDAPRSAHAIAVRWQGRPVEALPFVRLPSARADPRLGFGAQMSTAWLLVERQGERCKARDAGARATELEGLFEQVGRNTGYLIHPEEILADNFALLYREYLTPGVARIRSPEILEKMVAILN
jgi:hypothetical protein